MTEIEASVGQNIEEISEFGRGNMACGWRILLEKYNERVLGVKIDRSLFIEILTNLQ